jgi:hypothetical protein
MRTGPIPHCNMLLPRQSWQRACTLRVIHAIVLEARSPLLKWRWLFWCRWWGLHYDNVRLRPITPPCTRANPTPIIIPVAIWSTVTLVCLALGCVLPAVYEVVIPIHTILVRHNSPLVNPRTLHFLQDTWAHCGAMVFALQTRLVFAFVPRFTIAIVCAHRWRQANEAQHQYQQVANHCTPLPCTL